MDRPNPLVQRTGLAVRRFFYCGVALREHGSTGWICTACLGFGLITVLLFWLSSGVSLLDDDWGHLRLCVEGIQPILTTGWTGIAGAGGYYRPVVTLSLYATFLFVEYEPVLYHVGNVLIHVLCGILVYLLARRLLAGALSAWIALLLFHVLPVHTDTIFWIVGRTDSVCTLFYLSALLLFLDYQARPTPGLLAGGSLCFLLALFSKEMALSLPGVLLILCFYGRTFRAPEARRALAFCLVTVVVYLCARWMVLGGIFSGIPVRNLAATGLGLDVLKSGAKLGMTDYRLFGVVLLVATAGVFWVSGRPREVLRDTLYLGGMTVASLVPVLGRVHRWYLYLPSVFFCIAVANVWTSWQPNRRVVLWCRNFLMATLIGYYGLVLAREGVFWRDASVLSENVLDALAPLTKESSGAVYVLNVPSALSPAGSLGEIPLFSFGLSSATAVRAGVGTPAVAVNHCWLTDSDGFESDVKRLGPMHWRIDIKNGGYFSVHRQDDVRTFYAADGKRLLPGTIKRTWGEVRIHGLREAEVVLEPVRGSRVVIFDRGGIRELKLENE